MDIEPVSMINSTKSKQKPNNKTNCSW